MIDGKKKKRILVVEDEPDTRIFLSTLLATGGFKPVLSRSGTEGLRKAVAKAPDLIILDMMMSKEDPIQIYRTLRSDPGLSRIPVVMLSAIDKKFFFFHPLRPSSGTSQTLPEPEAYLEKPLESADLLRTVRILMESRRSEA